MALLSTLCYLQPRVAPRYRIAPSNLGCGGIADAASAASDTFRRLGLQRLARHDRSGCQLSLLCWRTSGMLEPPGCAEAPPLGTKLPPVLSNECSIAMNWLVLLLGMIIALGHFALWIVLHNWINAIHFTRPLQKAINLATLGMAVLGPAAFVGALAYWLLSPGASILGTSTAEWTWQTAGAAPGLPASAYAALCILIAMLGVPRFLYRYHTAAPPAALVANHCQSIDVGRQLGEPLAAPGLRGWMVRLPGNQTLQLEVREKHLRIPRLDAALDGFTIAHLSDLHYTGKISRAYFEEVVRRANAFEADLIAITGDLLDKSDLVEWLPHTLGRLRAPLGVYCVLGNHDRRVDVDRLRSMLAELGFHTLGGKTVTIEHRGTQIFLAGNELPWFQPAAEVPLASTLAGDAPLRILLSHSPDQIAWARQRHFDLMLAGHTHGGQIRLPGIGPLISPSFYGVRYASGTFELPPTVMHVSQGISGKTPLRYGCPPELAKLVLVR